MKKLLVCALVAAFALTARGEAAEAKKPNAPFPGWTAQRKRVKVATPQGDRFKEITYYTNTIGMKFVKIPAGEFMMGAKYQKPVHKVRISKPFYMGAHEVTNEQYRRFRRDHNSREFEGNSMNGDKQPVVYVSWNDATAFCEWLSRKEGIQCRLPTEAEWEYACRAGSSAPYPWGDEISAKRCNFADKNSSFPWRDSNADDGHAVAAPVGTYLPNGFGLYDTIGNVWEWCQDWYGSGYYASSPKDDPTGPSSGSGRVSRGGSWGDRPWYCRADYRQSGYPSGIAVGIGFRVVALSRKAEQQRATKAAAAAREAEHARLANRAKAAPKPQAWKTERKRVKVATPQGDRFKEITYYTNPLGMKFVKIAAGEFMMGSHVSPEALAKQYNTKATDFEREQPLHKVRITKPFYMGAHEVTNEQYRRFKRSHNSKEYKGNSLNGDKQPVVYVSRNDAKAFCDWLSRKEGVQYRLPTEAEWEYACRAGSSAPYPWGEKISAKSCNFADKNCSYSWRDANADDGHAVTAPVGTYLPNGFGLYDTIGNVWEWCQDWYGSGYYASSPKDDPTGPSSGSSRVLRGGTWYFTPRFCRAADRAGADPTSAINYAIGFRVVALSRARP